MEDSSQHLKTMIKNCESRLVHWKLMLEDIHKNKDKALVNDEFMEWYKEFLRDMKNFDQILLKELVEEKRYENEELNPPHFYPWNKKIL